MAPLDWFHITFDDAGIRLDVQPPNGTPWKSDITWNVIERICFEVGDFLETDTIYIFTRERPESYVIPTDGVGGGDLWGEIVRRGLFDAELAIQLVTADSGIYCWP